MQLNLNFILATLWSAIGAGFASPVSPYMTLSPAASHESEHP